MRTRGKVSVDHHFNTFTFINMINNSLSIPGIEIKAASVAESHDFEFRCTPRQQDPLSARGRDASVGTNGEDVGKSPDKLQDILSYLDNVEDSCEKTLLETRRSIPESNRSEVEFVVEPDIAEDVPK